ncbi:Regulatory protein BlaI [Anaerohalosphaera lusitana]|uniref:Regulatory protein BlaI n=1 Tax=Anaerohalosphaera lusitana TaxID=1936003 RepID=A0A1U9NQI5_9BACT|nr:BlaI/MecI/CopY family transcriptional regulator [Anaerohalosphaera lusitana]AQT69988.1 Regulatory protein BlaI [Anaerohalosphaera lusitana]
MPRKQSQKENSRPSELELQVLSVLWDKGPASVRDVMNSLPDGKQRAYTSVLSVMQVMEKKRLLTHTRQGNTHIYKPTKPRRAVVDPLMKRLASNIFNGSKVSMVQSLLGSEKLTDAELAKLEQLIESKKK